MDPKYQAIIIFGIAYLLIARGRIPHSIIAILGAVALVLVGVVSETEALHHVDLEVIFLLGGMMSLAHVAGRTGAFDWAALKSAQLVRGNGFGILCLISLLTAVGSAFLDNVTVVVLAVPITFSLCRTLNLNPTPFLLAQVFASNIGGTATIVGDPPNIIIASVGDISFLNFLLNMAPVSVVSMVALLGLLWVWFRKDVRTSESSRLEVMKQVPGEAITDKTLLIKSGIVLTLTVIGFMTHEILGVGPAFIAIAGAGLLVLISGIEPGDVLRHVEWSSLVFFTGLFILVGGLVETGVTMDIQEWMVDISDGDEKVLAVFIVWFGGFASAIVDNIPFTATMVQVVKDLPGVATGPGDSPLWWALALGADLGGNATLVGASANVIVVSLARASGHPISFMKFLSYGAVITVVSLGISTGYLFLRFYI